MTIHAAKGLEFPHVFISGLEENLFPSIQSLNNRADLEEERRLFYVALTRGMESVNLSYAENRYRWGDLIPCEPSRFIEEIDSEYIEVPRKASMSDHAFDLRKTQRPDTKETPRGIVNPPRNLKKLSTVTNMPQPKFTDEDSILNLQPGMMVEHERFGKGKVQSIEGDGSNRKAVIFFQLVGQKQLLLKFARLKIL
jgi:DNA helicase-2/ATP-dependent DNA helicase PcrA